MEIRAKIRESGKEGILCIPIEKNNDLYQIKEINFHNIWLENGSLILKEGIHVGISGNNLISRDLTIDSANKMDIRIIDDYQLLEFNKFSILNRNFNSYEKILVKPGTTVCVSNKSSPLIFFTFKHDDPNNASSEDLPIYPTYEFILP